MKAIRWSSLVCICLLDSHSRAAEKPNILFLLSDDHSYHLDGPATKGQRGAPVIGETLDRYELRRFTDRVDYVEKGGGLRDFGGKLAAFLDAVPGELTNLAGNKKYAQVERELKETLTEKMVLDWDFLPTPLR